MTPAAITTPAHPGAGGRLVLVESAMGSATPCLMVAPRGAWLPPGVHEVTPLLFEAARPRRRLPRGARDVVAAAAADPERRAALGPGCFSSASAPTAAASAGGARGVVAAAAADPGRRAALGLGCFSSASAPAAAAGAGGARGVVAAAAADPERRAALGLGCFSSTSAPAAASSAGGFLAAKIMLAAGSRLPRGMQAVAAFPPTAVLSAAADVSGSRRAARMMARAAGADEVEPGNTASDETFYIFMEEQAMSLLNVITELSTPPDQHDVKLEALKARLARVVFRAKAGDMCKLDLAVDLMRGAYTILEVTCLPTGNATSFVSACLHSGKSGEAQWPCVIGPEVEETDAILLKAVFAAKEVACNPFGSMVRELFRSNAARVKQQQTSFYKYLELQGLSLLDLVADLVAPDVEDAKTKLTAATALANAGEKAKKDCVMALIRGAYQIFYIGNIRKNLPVLEEPEYTTMCVDAGERAVRRGGSLAHGACLFGRCVASDTVAGG